MRKLKLTIMTTLVGTVALAAQAAPMQILLNCQLNDKVYTNNLVYVLNKVTPKQVPQVYFFKNKSAYSLVLDHPVNKAGAQAGWSSSLSPGKWSAIAVSQTGFAVRCSIENQHKFYQSDCAKLISVCQPATGATTNSEGNYWVTEDQSWSKFVQVLKSKNILKDKSL